MVEKTSLEISDCNAKAGARTEAVTAPKLESTKDSWLTVLGSFLIYYSSFGILNSFGFFQDLYENEFFTSTSPSTISFIGTLQLALTSSLATISGGWCDSHGITYPYVCSGLGTASAFFTLSFCTSGSFFQIFLCQGLFMGVSIAIGVQPALTIVGQHFQRRQALAMGIVCAGGATGGVCYSIMFTQLQPIIGFSWMMRVVALKVLLCYSIALSISTSNPAGSRIELKTLLDFRGFLDIRYTVLAIGGWLASLGIWVPSYHIKLYANATYPQLQICDYLPALLNSVSILGMVLGGLIGDEIGRLNILWPTILFSSLSCLSLWLLSSSLPMLILFVCFFGFGSGVFTALVPPIIGQMTPPAKIGARIGALYSVVAIATLIGAPISGALIEKKTKEGYRGLIVFAGATMLLASLVVFCARALHDRNLRAKW